MARAETRGRSAPKVTKEPPAAKSRKQVGQFNAKVGRTERTQIAMQAVQRKQEIPWQTIFGVMGIFAVVASALYLYLDYVVNDEDVDVEPSY